MSRFSLRRSASGRQRATPRPRLGVESLERRDLMAGISFDAPTGVLTIIGSTHNDESIVSQAFGRVKASLVCKSDTSGQPPIFTDFKNLPASSVKEIVFDGQDGNDKFWNGSPIKAAAAGGDGDDQLSGGTGVDIFVGGLGKDTVSGNGGNDILWGWGGNDVLYGGTGGDVLKGDAGNDRLYGGSGNDQLFGGAEVDSLYGESGNDVIVAIGGDFDLIRGGSQWDNVWMDTTDNIADASANEVSLKYIHKVNQFYSYSYNGGQTSFPVSKELEGQELLDPHHEDGAGAPVATHEFATRPLFASNGPNADDVFQREVGDCYMLARLSAVADANPEVIRKMVVDLGDGTYAVRFYRFGIAQYVRVDADLWVKPGTNTPYYARLGRQDSIWVPIVEKAYAFWRTKMGHYDSIAGGGAGFQHVSEELGLFQVTREQSEPVSAVEVLAWDLDGRPSGGVKNQIKAAVTDFLSWILAQREAGNAVTIGGKASLSNTLLMRLDDATTPDENESTWRRGEHIFMVDRVLTNSAGTPTGLVVRNPWGNVGPNQDGYLTLTDFARIYFCIGGAASAQV
jgi:Calpain family cysteine protease/RTX calcium-binding nonapeptide repeat (4 copies)